MPKIIKTINEIMTEEKKDFYLLIFDVSADWREKNNAAIRQTLLAWLKAGNVDYVTAAPKGWLEGDPACYAVFFEGSKDSRLEEFLKTFRSKQGSPKLYQLRLMPYIKDRGRAH